MSLCITRWGVCCGPRLNAQVNHGLGPPTMFICMGSSEPAECCGNPMRFVGMLRWWGCWVALQLARGPMVQQFRLVLAYRVSGPAHFAGISASATCIVRLFELEQQLTTCSWSYWTPTVVMQLKASRDSRAAG